MSEFIKNKARPQIFNLKPYVPGKPIEEVQRELGIDDIIKLASNENPLGPSPLGQKAFSEVVDKLHIYPDANCFRLKQKLSRMLDCNPQDLLVGNGSDELLKLLAETFLNPGDEIIFAQPSFAEYEFTATIMGATSVKVPLIDFKHDLNAMLAAITPRTKMLYICNPNNPTGAGAPLEFLSHAVDFAAEHDLLICYDNPYCDVTFDGYQAPSILQIPGAKQVAIEFNSHSKTYNMAGWRVGYMVGNKELVSALARIKSYHDYGTFTPIQVASIIALDGDQACVEEVRAMYQNRRDVLAKGLHEAGWMVEVPKASMYIWAKIPEAYAAMGSLEFAKKLLAEARVAVSPGVGFGEYGDDHVRFALIENEARIRQAIRGIKDMFRKDGLL